MPSKRSERLEALRCSGGSERRRAALALSYLVAANGRAKTYGGYWDKLGNRFEDKWALHQLVLMTGPDSNIESLVREPVGDDERGVDLWIYRKDNIRECHQCCLSAFRVPPA